MSALPPLTIIIPTHNRGSYIRRAIQYWSKTDHAVLIVDSSTDPTPLEYVPNIDLLSLPGASFVTKLRAALDSVKTPFVTLCPDDDFHVPSTLNACASFLDENVDYASVQGHYLSFCDDGRQVHTWPTYVELHGLAIENDDPAYRLIVAMRNYVIQLWAVHRVEHIRRAFNVCDDRTNANAVELSTSLIPLMAGKHRVIPALYSAREAAAESWGSRTPSVESWLTDPTADSAINDWTSRLAQSFVAYTSASPVVAKRTIADAIEGYRDFAKPKPAPAWQSSLRRLAGPALLKALSNLRSGGPCRSRWAAGARDDCRTTPGYPWSDSLAASSWACIESVIVASR